MITHKQRELLEFIDVRMRETGVTPSYDEMAGALALKSKSGIHRLVSALQERGFIRRLPNRARAIEVIRKPERGTVTPFPVREQAQAPAPRSVSVPLMGRIAAGTPIAAIQEQGRSFEVPSGMLHSGEHYALEVRGDSMIEAGILDGDIAVIRRQETADAGDIVVALVDGEEATLKRFRRRGTSVALEAANPAYPTRVLDSARVRIQGRLVTLVRRY